jgi:hypothetical protein
MIVDTTACSSYGNDACPHQHRCAMRRGSSCTLSIIKSGSANNMPIMNTSHLSTGSVTCLRNACFCIDTFCPIQCTALGAYAEILVKRL